MPTVDSDHRVVGIVLREDPETSNYSQCFLVINFASRLLSLYPLEAAGASDFTGIIPIEEIKCSYITKVSVTQSRPKVLNCFELVTTGVSRLFSVNSLEERDEWIDAIKQSSMSQKAFLPDPQSRAQYDTAYKNQIIGGVIQRKLISKVETSGEERSELTSSGPASLDLSSQTTQMPSSPSSSSPEKKKQTLIIKAGFATKCGAVMKNWKRRFFVLNDQSLGYYKCIEEVDPIRSVAVSDMLSVGPSRIHASKDHLLELATPSRTFYIQADTESDMKDWIEAFQSVIRLSRSSNSMPVTTKDRTASNHLTEDMSHITIQPYDASPKIGPSSTVAQKDNRSSKKESPTPPPPNEHSNGDDSLEDAGLIGIAV